MPAAHEQLACDACHLNLRAVAAAGGEDPVSRVCGECHDPAARVRANDPGFHADRRRGCRSCHVFHEPSRIRAAGRSFRFDFDAPGLLGHCASCHAGGRPPARLSVGHRAAADVYHADSRDLAGLSPSAGCLRCHSRDAADPRALARADRPPRFHAEASHPSGIPVRGGRVGGYGIRREIDPRLRLFSGLIECQTCHEIGDDAESLLVRFEHPYDLCLGCHERRGEGRGEGRAGALAAMGPGGSPARVLPSLP